MNKKLVFAVLGLVVVASMLIAAAGASWSVETNAVDNNFQSAKFDVSIGANQGDSGSKTVSAVFKSPDNWAPGDDPVHGTIYLHNSGTIPVNVVWSGFSVTGNTVLANNICVTEFGDSNNTTSINDLASFIDPSVGCVTLTKAAQALGNGYFSDPNNTNSYKSVFIQPGEDASVDLTLVFRAGAGNDTIDKQVGFTWTLTAMQVAKNSQP